MKKNNITLTSIILPRIEVFYLEEWIEHYLGLGVDKILLYNNGLIPVAAKNPYWNKMDAAEKDRRKSLQSAPDHQTWDCKPHLDYFSDYSDAEILDKLNDINSKYDEVKVIPWVCGEDHDFPYPISQNRMFARVLNDKKSNWVLNVDPDEYIVLKNHSDLKDFIDEYNDFNYFRFYGKMFTKRLRDKPVREIYSNCGLWVGGASKWLAKIPENSKITQYNPHDLIFTDIKAKIFKDEKDIWFNHYKAEVELKDFDNIIKKHIK
jgi:hypothetical protein